MPTGSLRLMISEFEYKKRGRFACEDVEYEVSDVTNQKTHTSSFASLFSDFFCFRFLTFSHDASTT